MVPDDKYVALDLDALERALGQLREALDLRIQRPHDLLVRDALIQRFEYSFELAGKTIRRFIKNNAMDLERAKLELLSHVIRTAWAAGIVNVEWEAWKEFRNARNLTSHVYSEAMLSVVLPVVEPFYEAAVFALARMKEETA